MKRAKVDEKEVKTDWVQNVFDDLQCIKKFHHVIGMINGCVVSCMWNGFAIYWQVSRDLGGDYVTAFLLLEQRLTDCMDDLSKQGIVSTVKHLDRPYELIQKFYFKEQ